MSSILQTLNIPLQVKIDYFNSGWYAYCDELNLGSWGDEKKEALEGLEKVVTAYLQEYIKEKT